MLDKAYMKKKIPVQDLIKGMFVCGNDRKWLETPFFRSKFLVTTETQIQEIRAYCHFVFIDTEKGLDVPSQPVGFMTDQSSPVQTLYQAGQQTFSVIQERVTANHTLELSACRKFVSDLLFGLNRYSGDLLKLTWQDSELDSSKRNTVDICIQSLALGKKIGLETGVIQDLGLLALFCNLGTGLVSPFLDTTQLPLVASPNQPPLSEQIVSNIAGVDLLKVIPDRGSTAWREVDPQLVAIIEIAATFNLLRSPELQTEPVIAQAALQQMAILGADMFDADLLGYFIELTSLYPLDCFVELNTGEIGLVVEINPHNPSRPIVSIVTDAQKQLREQETLCMLEHAQEKPLSIVRALPVNEPILEILLLHRKQINALSDND